MGTFVAPGVMLRPSVEFGIQFVGTAGTCENDGVTLNRTTKCGFWLDKGEILSASGLARKLKTKGPNTEMICDMTQNISEEFGCPKKVSSSPES